MVRRHPLNAVLLAAAAASSVGACRDTELPPYGEAVLEIDTDVLVPALVDRLRIDIFDQEGRWMETRDVARPDPRDWPVSFGVYSRDETSPTRVLVRVRAYLEGFVRDYRGERPEPPLVGPPKVAGDLATMCRDAPVLPMNGVTTLRRGKDPVTKTPTCSAPATTGSVAARITITDEADYRVGVVAAEPQRGTLRVVPLAWSIALRRQCDDESSEIACSAPNGTLDAHLLPGDYALVTGGAARLQPADLTLRVARAEDWDKPPASTSPPPALSPIELPDAALTPRSEPEPGVAIDRLVVAELDPGVRARLHVDLHGACFGQPADLAVEGGRASPAKARTCVSRERELQPVVPEPPRRDPPSGAHATATFGATQPCEGTWPRDGRACIPGGAYVFGGSEFRAFEESSSWPPRVARMTRFLLDVEEVSVGRWRSAVARGFVSSDPVTPRANEGPLGTKVPPTEEADEARLLCTWSTSPQGREHLPVNCISWYSARAFCNFSGGDLPTEAQWEYAASAAGRPSKTAYPWGDSEIAPRCDEATWGRSNDSIVGGGACYRPEAFAPSPTASPGVVDVTPVTGVRGLAGNVNEWLLDSAEPFTSECWRATGVTDPACLVGDAPLRSIRGGSWLGIPDALRPLFRSRQDPGKTLDLTAGFRCAYPGPR